jgi:acyl-CoA dehydrogenase
MTGVLHPTVDPHEAIEVGEEVGRLAAPFAAVHDRDGTFVDEGYAAVRKLSYGALAVPQDLGGGGHGLEGMCKAQAAMAKGCPSTALAMAMHTHAVLGMAWRRGQGDTEVAEVLRRVATEGLLLSASGTLVAARIGIEARPVPGGYSITGRRRLVSGAPGADRLVIAARLVSAGGERPITILAPLSGEGVKIVDDWDALGMRGSGTNSVSFRDVFVPTDDALYVDRGNYRPQPPGTMADERPVDDLTRSMRMPGLHISLPIIGAVYLGAADGACREAIRTVAGTSRVDNPGAGHLAGVMAHEIRLGWWALEGMVRETSDETLGTNQQMITTLLGKRQVVGSAIRAAEAAMELLGSSTYLRGNLFERTLRDVRAGITHPLPPEASLVQVGWATLDEAARPSP